MKLFSKAFLVSALFVFATSAVALTIEEGKKGGAIGEKQSGYLAVVQSGNAAAEKLVAEVNAKRRAAYQAIAQKNKSDIKLVEQLGAKEAIQNSPVGTFVESVDGKWAKKK